MSTVLVADGRPDINPRPHEKEVGFVRCKRCDGGDGDGSDGRWGEVGGPHRPS